VQKSLVAGAVKRFHQTSAAVKAAIKSRLCGLARKVGIDAPSICGGAEEIKDNRSETNLENIKNKTTEDINNDIEVKDTGTKKIETEKKPEDMKEPKIESKDDVVENPKTEEKPVVKDEIAVESGVSVKKGEDVVAAGGKVYVPEKTDKEFDIMSEIRKIAKRSAERSNDAFGQMKKISEYIGDTFEKIEKRLDKVDENIEKVDAKVAQTIPKKELTQILGNIVKETDDKIGKSKQVIMERVQAGEELFESGLNNIKETLSMTQDTTRKLGDTLKETQNEVLVSIKEIVKQLTGLNIDLTETRTTVSDLSKMLQDRKVIPFKGQVTETEESDEEDISDPPHITMLKKWLKK